MLSESEHSVRERTTHQLHPSIGCYPGAIKVTRHALTDATAVLLLSGFEENGRPSGSHTYVHAVLIALVRKIGERRMTTCRPAIRQWTQQAVISNICHSIQTIKLSRWALRVTMCSMSTTASWSLVLLLTRKPGGIVKFHEEN